MARTHIFKDEYYKFEGKTFLTLAEALKFIKTKKTKSATAYLEHITVYEVKHGKK